MTESQKAFAEWYGDNPTELSPLANRTTQQTLDAWVWQSWQAAEAYGRKQALEDAVQICKSVPYQNDSYVAGVTLCKSAIEKLIK
jgi:uncharacterized Zn finger protein